MAAGTCTYYAYNAPAVMKAVDFEIMIEKHANCTVRVANISTQDNETMLTFDQPG